MPFYVLGIALCATALVSMIIALTASIRRALRTSIPLEGSTITALHSEEDESLRDAA